MEMSSLSKPAWPPPLVLLADEKDKRDRKPEMGDVPPDHHRQRLQRPMLCRQK